MYFLSPNSYLQSDEIINNAFLSHRFLLNLQHPHSFTNLEGFKQVPVIFAVGGEQSK